MMATYIHGSIKPMQKVDLMPALYFYNIAIPTSSFLWKIISRNQICSKENVLYPISLNSFIGRVRGVHSLVCFKLWHQGLER